MQLEACSPRRILRFRSLRRPFSVFPVRNFDQSYEAFEFTNSRVFKFNMMHIRTKMQFLRIAYRLVLH